MPQIVVNLTDEQYRRTKSAIARHLGLQTPSVSEVKSEKGEIEVAAAAAVSRDADDSELETFLIEHLRQMVVMVEKQEYVADKF